MHDARFLGVDQSGAPFDFVSDAAELSPREAEVAAVIRAVSARLERVVRALTSRAGARVSNVFLRRYAGGAAGPDGRGAGARRALPAHFDTDAYATATLDLDPTAHAGGLYVQARARARARVGPPRPPLYAL